MASCKSLISLWPGLVGGWFEYHNIIIHCVLRNLYFSKMYALVPEQLLGYLGPWLNLGSAGCSVVKCL